MKDKKQASLDQVAKQFDEWRERRQRRGPIPANLWKTACQLTKTYPITLISKALKVNPTVLRQRSQFLMNGTKSKRAGSGDFIEVNLSPQQQGRYPFLDPSGRIEFEKANGTKLKIYPGERIVLDAMAVARSFMRGSKRTKARL